MQASARTCPRGARGTPLRPAPTPPFRHESVGGAERRICGMSSRAPPPPFAPGARACSKDAGHGVPSRMPGVPPPEAEVDSGTAALERSQARGAAPRPPPRTPPRRRRRRQRTTAGPAATGTGAGVGTDLGPRGGDDALEEPAGQQRAGVERRGGRRRGGERGCGAT